MNYTPFIIDEDRMIFFIPKKPTFDSIEGIGIIVNKEILVPTNKALREIATKDSNHPFLILNNELKTSLCHDYHYCLDCSHRNKKS